jgi:hypothetical protein
VRHVRDTAGGPRAEGHEAEQDLPSVSRGNQDHGEEVALAPRRLPARRPAVASDAADGGCGANCVDAVAGADVAAPVCWRVTRWGRVRRRISDGGDDRGSTPRTVQGGTYAGCVTVTAAPSAASAVLGARAGLCR